MRGGGQGQVTQALPQETGLYSQDIEGLFEGF